MFPPCDGVVMRYRLRERMVTRCSGEFALSAMFVPVHACVSYSTGLRNPPPRPRRSSQLQFSKPSGSAGRTVAVQVPPRAPPAQKPERRIEAFIRRRRLSPASRRPWRSDPTRRRPRPHPLRAALAPRCPSLPSQLAKTTTLGVSSLSLRRDVYRRSRLRDRFQRRFDALFKRNARPPLKLRPGQ